MNIFQVISLAILGAALALTIRPFRPELAMIVGLVTGLIVLLFAVGELTGLLDSLRGLAAQYGIQGTYVSVLLKIIGIAYAAQFGAQVCTDAGESAIAGKVELCGRILILAAAVPVAAATISTAAGLLGPVS